MELAQWCVSSLPEKIAVSEVGIEDYGDAEGQADQGQGGHQQLPQSVERRRSSDWAIFQCPKRKSKTTSEYKHTPN